MIRSACIDNLNEHTCVRVSSYENQVALQFKISLAYEFCIFELLSQSALLIASVGNFLFACCSFVLEKKITQVSLVYISFSKILKSLESSKSLQSLPCYKIDLGTPNPWSLLQWGANRVFFNKYCLLLFDNCIIFWKVGILYTV